MSSGIESVTLTEARGNIAPPPPIDKASVVIGCSSTGAVGLHGPYASVSALNAECGYGPGPTAVAYLIAEYGIPAWLYRPPSSTPGVAAATVTAAIVGSASASAAIGGVPYDDDEAWYQIQGTAAVGTALKMKWSLDRGTTQSPTVNVGAGLTYGIPNSGVVITFGVAGQTYADGDIGTAVTSGPKWAAADIDTAGLPAGALCQSPYEFAHLYLAGPCSATEAGHVTTMLNNLKSVGKIVDAVIHTRWPNVDGTETESVWKASVETDFLSFNDDRINPIEGKKTIVIDPVTSQVHHRTWAYAYFARMLASERNTWVGSPDDGGFASPDGGTDLVQLYDSTGTLIGHDEGPSGNVTGLSDAFGAGNRFTCLVRGSTSQSRRKAYTTVPWVAFTTGGRVFTFMQRRIAQAIERDALDVSFASLGGTNFYDTNETTGISTLTIPAGNAIHHVIFDALTGDKYAEDIENSADDDPTTGLVQVNPVVTVAPGNLVTIAVTLAPKIAGKILSIGLTYAAQ